MRENLVVSPAMKKNTAFLSLFWKVDAVRSHPRDETRQSFLVMPCVASQGRTCEGRKRKDIASRPKCKPFCMQKKQRNNNIFFLCKTPMYVSSRVIEADIMKVVNKTNPKQTWYRFSLKRAGISSYNFVVQKTPECVCREVACTVRASSRAADEVSQSSPRGNTCSCKRGVRPEKLTPRV